MTRRTPSNIVRFTITTLVLAAALVAVVPVGATPKEEIANRRAQAVAARAEMARLGAQLEPAIERYNRAVVELEQVNAEIAYNQQRITFTKANLATTQVTLDEKLEQSYRVGEPDLITSILGQQSLSDILAVSELFDRSQNQAADLIGGLQNDKRALASQRKALDKAEARATELRAQRAAEKVAIDQGVAKQQSLAVGLEGEIATLMAEEQARQERLRTAAIDALAAQEAANSGSSSSSSSGGDISIGGSVDVGDGGAIELPPTDGSIGAQAVAAAMQYLGTPYVWGGASPGGFDCSGLTQYAYAQVGVSITHYTGSQWNEGVRVPADQLLPGDLVFFHSDLGHMGMYIGNGQMIHAPQTGDVVKISPLSYVSEYQGAVRPY